MTSSHIVRVVVRLICHMYCSEGEGRVIEQGRDKESEGRKETESEGRGTDDGIHVS